MTSSRQRMLDAFHFDHPDRIPLVYHPSTAGLHVHGQKLLDLFNQYPSDNPITFDSLPAPPPDTIDAQGRYHKIKKDDWDVDWEYLIFGIAGHPKYYPLDSWEAGRDYPFPPIPAPGSSEEKAQRLRIEEEKRDYLVFSGGLSLFERLHAVRPLDELLIACATGDRHFLAFLDRLTAYWHAVLDYLLPLGVDVVTFGDDWGTQNAPIVSPALFRDLFKPRYRELMDRIKQAGSKVFFHCCGQVGPLFDDFLELGIDGYWPQITCYDPDELAAKCREHQVAIYIHPDRQQLIPLGTPEKVDAYIRTCANRYRALGGGAIFYVEMENDAPFTNVKALFEAIDKYR